MLILRSRSRYHKHHNFEVVVGVRDILKHLYQLWYSMKIALISLGDKAMVLLILLGYAADV